LLCNSATGSSALSAGSIICFFTSRHNLCHGLELHQPTYQLSSPPQLESQARAANARLERAGSAGFICWSKWCSTSEVVLLFQLRFGAERSGANWAETTAIRVEPTAEHVGISVCLH
jgi:hypothetical protein